MKKLTLLLIPVLAMGMVSCGGEKNAAGDNPFFAEWDTPYGMPPFDKIRPEHFKPAYEHAMRLHNEEIEAIVNNTEEPNFENTIFALDNAGEMLSKVRSAFGMLSSADTNDQIKAVSREMSPILTAHSDNINLNQKLFERVKSVYDNREALGLDQLQARLTEKRYKSFVNSGAELSDGDKEKMRRLNTELSKAQLDWGNNLLDANNAFVMVVEEADLAGLPESTVAAAKELAEGKGHTGKYAFTLDKPSMLPFLTYSDRRDLREQLYRGYLDRCNEGSGFDNRELINEIIRIRMERSKLLGFETYADYVLEDRMAKTIDNVYALLDDLWTPSLRGAKKELTEMKRIKMQETGSDDFESWDWWYYAEKVRKAKYDLDEEEVRPYLAINNVRNGIFDLCDRLYGISFEQVSVPVYNSECVTYKVTDNDGSHLGILLMDFHPRSGKRGGAWCGSFQSREFDIEGNKTKDPIVYIVCNFTRPSGDAPALLTMDEAETFFHEFGHALHSLFGMAPYKTLGRTERDFVELPSQIMENWAFTPELLRSYARHYQSGDVIPDALITKIQNSALFNQGFAMTEFIAAAYTDMDIHILKEYKHIDVNGMENDALYVKRGLIPEIAPRYRYPYYNHIFSSGYAAGYYSYKWAEVLDKDAYHAFVETGNIFNREVAARFRNEVLSKGGTADGMELYVNFRGHEPDRKYLLEARGLME